MNQCDMKERVGETEVVDVASAAQEEFGILHAADRSTNPFSGDSHAFCGFGGLHGGRHDLRTSVGVVSLGLCEAATRGAAWRTASMMN